MLGYTLPQHFQYAGHVFSVKVPFDKVLRMFEIVEDNNFDDEEKVNILLELFLSRTSNFRVFCVHRFSPIQLQEILQQIFQEFIEGPKRPKLGSSTPLMDFTQDWDYIYSSFVQAYNIDLFQVQGKLDWRLFTALLSGLPKNTKIKEVQQIRGEKIPEPTKYNQEQIRALQEAKLYYRLNFSEEKQEQIFQEGVNQLAENLLQQARRNSSGTASESPVPKV